MTSQYCLQKNNFILLVENYGAYSEAAVNRKGD